MKNNIMANNATATLGLNQRLGHAPVLNTSLTNNVTPIDELRNSLALNNNRKNESFYAKESFRSNTPLVQHNLRHKDIEPSRAERNMARIGNYIDNDIKTVTPKDTNKTSNIGRGRNAPGAYQALQAGAESAGAISQGHHNSWIIGNNAAITNKYYNNSAGAFGNFEGQAHRAMLDAGAETRAQERVQNYSNTGKAFAGPFGQFVGSMIGRSQYEKFAQEERGKTNYKFASNSKFQNVDPRDSITSTYHGPREQISGRSNKVDPTVIDSIINPRGGPSDLHPNNNNSTTVNKTVPMSKTIEAVSDPEPDRVSNNGGPSAYHPNNNNSTNTNIVTPLSTGSPISHPILSSAGNNIANVANNSSDTGIGFENVSESQA